MINITSIKLNYLNLKREIEQINKEVKIVVVTKYVQDINLISQLADIGITDIAESYAQKLEEKVTLLQSQNFDTKKYNWHFIGHLQSNKVKKVVPIADLIQSIDDIELALEIDKQAKKINKIQNCLIEIKVSPETTKSGCPIEKVEELIKRISELENVQLCGLMTMAPYFENPELTRPFFRQAKKVFDTHYSLLAANYSLPYLSMGMSNDYKIAVEEGANMVRIGSKIFE